MARVRKALSKVLPVVLVAGLGAGGWFGFHSEAFQRTIGAREDTELVADQVRPVYESAVVQSSAMSIVPGSPSTVEVMSTVTVDPTRAVAREEIARRLTGVDAMQTDVGGSTELEQVATRVWTLDSVLTAGASDADPWRREPTSGPYTRGTYLDPYLVPVRNDVIGLELATLPWRAPDRTPTDEGAAVPSVPYVAPERLPKEATDLRRWSFDLGTFRTLSPVAWAKTPFTDLGPTTPADVTMGFDTEGVLRYLQVTIDPTKADPGDEGAIFSFQWRVVSLADTPPTIEVPTDAVDAAPGGSAAVAPAP